MSFFCCASVFLPFPFALGRTLFVCCVVSFCLSHLRGWHDTFFYFSLFIYLLYCFTCFFVSRSSLSSHCLNLLTRITLRNNVLSLPKRWISVVFFCDLYLSINTRKNRHGHWVCWMSTSRGNTHAYMYPKFFYLFLCFPHPIYFVWYSPFFSLSLLLVVTQIIIRGHIASRLFFPLPTNNVRALHFYREKISALSSLVDSRRIVLLPALGALSKCVDRSYLFFFCK